MSASVDGGPDWGSEYDARRSTYRSLLDEVLFALRKSLKDADVKTHTIDGRVKERKSFIDKIKRKAYAQPFEDMPDIVGARIVCLFVNDLPRVQMIIERCFEVVNLENKMEMAPDDSFGYMSVHFECRIKEEHRGPRYDELKGNIFEVQSRTLLMDAWANVSHYLEYKGAASVPAEMRRGLNALSGLFYVADQQFQTVYDAAIQSDQEAIDTYSGSLSTTPIDRATVLAMLTRVFPDRRLSRRDAADLAEELREYGFTSLDEVERLVTSATSLAREYESIYPPSMSDDEYEADDRDFSGEELDTNSDRLFWAVGIARQALDIAEPKYYAYRINRSMGREYNALLRHSPANFAQPSDLVSPYQTRYREQEDHAADST